MKVVIPDNADTTVIGFTEDGEQWRQLVAWEVLLDDAGIREPALTAILPGGLPDVYCLRDKWGFWFPSSGLWFPTLDEALVHGKQMVQNTVALDPDPEVATVRQRRRTRP